MFLEPFKREIEIAFENIDDDGSPGNDVSLLRVFVEDGVAVDDVGA